MTEEARQALVQMNERINKTFAHYTKEKLTKKDKMGSLGEQTCRHFLKKHKINFKEQKTFKGCVNPETGAPLRCDFYIPHLNLIIEIQGEQHYEPVNFGGKSQTEEETIAAFEDGLRRDKIKRDYLKAHNINYVDVPWRDGNTTKLERNIALAIQPFVDKYYKNKKSVEANTSTVSDSVSSESEDK